jgi:hypothetical protein
LTTIIVKKKLAAEVVVVEVRVICEEGEEVHLRPACHASATLGYT